MQFHGQNYESVSRRDDPENGSITLHRPPPTGEAAEGSGALPKPFEVERWLRLLRQPVLPL